MTCRSVKQRRAVISEIWQEKSNELTTTRKVK